MGGKFLPIKGGTILDNTYGCTKEHQLATSLHLISVFYAKNNFCIDRAIGAPDDGKYLVDGLNACDKQHLKRYMRFINQPHEGYKDRKIKPYLIYKKYSLTCS